LHSYTCSLLTQLYDLTDVYSVHLLFPLSNSSWGSDAGTTSTADSFYPLLLIAGQSGLKRRFMGINAPAGETYQLLLHNGVSLQEICPDGDPPRIIMGETALVVCSCLSFVALRLFAHTTLFMLVHRVASFFETFSGSQLPHTLLLYIHTPSTSQILKFCLHFTFPFPTVN